MMACICLVTTGQPTTNPRLVKEADALSEAGHEVHVICAHWARWADEMDGELLSTRAWASCRYVGGDLRGARTAYWWTRVRHGVSRRGLTLCPRSSLLRGRALCRVLPELERAAKERKADLYIAHNLGALPGAVAAAKLHGARVGFDAEDFHSGMRPFDCARTVEDDVTESLEREYLPRCDYVTAASPEIAAAYAAKYDLPLPQTILNVFPLAERPREFRPAQPGEPLRLYWFSQTIGAQRGLEDVVQALGMLRGCEIELHLRGQWQHGYRERLLAFAVAHGVSLDQIRHHRPSLPDEMVRLAAQYDIGLALEVRANLNLELCLSNKIFTYLLAGTALIATATRAQQAITDEIGIAGVHYQPGDVDSLAEILRHFYEDRDHLNIARQAAWVWGERRYNWDIEKKVLMKSIDSMSLPS